MYSQYRNPVFPQDVDADFLMSMQGDHLTITNYEKPLIFPQYRMKGELQVDSEYAYFDVNYEFSGSTNGYFGPIERLDTNTSLRALEADEDYDAPAEVSMTFPLNEEGSLEQFDALKGAIGSKLSDSSSVESINGLEPDAGHCEGAETLTESISSSSNSEDTLHQVDLNCTEELIRADETTPENSVDMSTPLSSSPKKTSALRMAKISAKKNLGRIIN